MTTFFRENAAEFNLNYLLLNELDLVLGRPLT
jgi:hypothetical protein